jgi:hypothetical protein
MGGLIMSIVKFGFGIHSSPKLRHEMSRGRRLPLSAMDTAHTVRVPWSSRLTGLVYWFFDFPLIPPINFSL